MIRAVTPADADRLVALTAATGFSRPHEFDALRGVRDAYFEGDTGRIGFASEAGRMVDGDMYLAMPI